MNKEDRLIVALDVRSLKEAEYLVSVLYPTVRTFKIGKELFTACGPEVVKMVHAQGARVFLDLKFHDIPNTVAGACLAAASMGVFMLNVHALGGTAMLEKAAAAVRDSGHPTLLIGVTVLTSLSDEDLKDVGIMDSARVEVVRLAHLCKRTGLNGVVASGQEIPHIRQAVGKDFLIVTPGVRPSWAAAGDQKRIVTPSEAVKQGADYIVVGRPITGYPDPKEAAQKILNELT